MAKYIELLEDWTNGPNEYVKGHRLEMAKDSEADELIQLGIAKEFKDAPKTVKEVNELNEDNIRKLVAESIKNALTELSTKAQGGPTQIVRDPARESEDYLKTGGYKIFGEFLQDVAQVETLKTISPRLSAWGQKTAGILSESDSTEGGYLVPAEFNARLLSTMIEAATIRPMAQFVPMQTNSIKFPAIVATTHASSLFGGIIIYRTDEGSQKNVSKPNFGQIQLTLHNLTGLIYVTNQLLEDSPISIEPLVYDLFGRAITWWEEDDFINGTGTGMALGALQAPCLIAQAKETGQAADTIVYQNIIKMWSRLHPMSRSRAVWHVNTDALPQLYQMSLAIGTGGSAVFMPPGGISSSPYAALMGRPLFDTEHCQTIGDQGDILLADWTQYLVGGKPGAPVRTASSMHLRFDYNEMAFRIETRYDGQPWWSSALTPKNSTTTLSPFVTLAERA